MNAYHYEGEGCVIHTPQPPRHWYNYLWNEDRYCAGVSQMDHGRSYYLNETAQMCMLNRDDARYVYVRDDGNNAVWNIGQGPVNNEVEDYGCTHAIGYSRLQDSDGLQSRQGNQGFGNPQKNRPGQPIEGSLLPDFRDGRAHTVETVL